MRQVILDTETTGLDPQQGHRVIEIGCIELVNRKITTRHFHHYINPEREIDAGALAVHGISTDFLKDKPRFAELAEEFLAFITGAELIIHNASFDISFLEAELQRLPDTPANISTLCTITDTLALARKRHPGQKNSLDALCKRYSVDNSNRSYHGALLDAQLLAEVYLRLTGGQRKISFEVEEAKPNSINQSTLVNTAINKNYELPVIAANDDEVKLHQQFVDLLIKNKDE